MSFIRKFLYVFSGRTKQLLMLVLVFLVTSLLEAFGIGMIGPFLKVAGEPELAQSNGLLNAIFTCLGLQNNSQLVILLGLFIIFVFLIKSVAYLFGKYYTFKTLLEQRSAIRIRLFRAYLTSPYEFHLNRNSSEFISRIVTEAQRFCNLVAVPFAEICSNVLVVAILVGLLAVTDITLFLLSVGTLLPAFVCFFLLSKRIKRWGVVAGEAREQTVKAVGHGLGGLKETRVLGCESYFQQDLLQYLDRESHMDTRFRSALYIPRTLIESVMMIAVIGFVCLSQFFLEQDFQAAISSMGVFAVTALRLIPACSQLVQNLGLIRNSTFTLDALYSDLKEVSKQEQMLAPSVPQSSQPLTFNCDLQLQNIVYRYPHTDTVSLDRISMTIRKGESIGLIGTSGAGKTTLVDVILGLLKLEAGDIQVDNRSIYGNLIGWKQLVGYIPQTIFLLDDTLEHNIAFGVPEANIDRQQLNYAIKAAQLEELVRDLPDGVHTKIGERGMRLSGGQRQRIGIAGALYHQREILVLDEATSALDNDTERLIGDAINNLAGAKTLIVVAHRLTTLEHCDRIYELEKGRIMRSGSYKDIILGQPNSELPPRTSLVADI